MRRVAILGCGPAGMLCALAVEQAGYAPTLYSYKVKSEIPGSLHLRGSIPDLTGQYPDSIVTIVRMGTPEGYAQKVYGDRERPTGWENYASVYPSWNAIAAYDDLWERYKDNIIHIEVKADLLDQVLKAYDVVVSTLPMPILCQAGHKFESVPYWIKKLPLPEGERGREIIIYNGRLDDPWYRYSILGDLCSIEAAHPAFEGDDVLEGKKAVGNDCDCWPGLVRAGRWAEWRHGVLLHDAYWKVRKLLEDR